MYYTLKQVIKTSFIVGIFFYSHKIENNIYFIYNENMSIGLRNFTLESIKKIQEARKQNKLVIFVGAGVSLNSGLPSWNDLVKHLAQKMGIEKKLDVEGVSLKADEIQKLNEKNSKFSADEYLKIPQYYFNERKESEYLKTIKDFFSKETNPNIIDSIIFELNPEHIITTNYDDLLEKACNSSELNKSYYCKISCNEDLAMARNNNFIIKMHGDFSRDNFVLKEEDYDNYSNDFKLIETYVKGLIATNTILFVGFSADDMNVRKIFQWVKDILGTNQQPAYLIDIDEYKSTQNQRMRFDYLKGINIHTIYYNEIEQDINEFIKNDKDYNNKIKIEMEKNQYFVLGKEGETLYKILYYILHKEIYTKNNSYIDECYKKLKELECFSYIPNFILEKIFKCNIRQILSVPSPFNLAINKDIRKCVDDLRLKKSLIYNLTDNEYEDLYAHNLILNSLIEKATEEDPKQIKEKLKEKLKLMDTETDKIKYIFERIVTNNPNEQLHDSLIYYNYNDIVTKIKSLDIEEYSNSVSVFKRAFLLFKIGEYKKSFDELNKISLLAFQKKDYVLYILAEFNKNNLSVFIHDTKYKKTNITRLVDKLISPNIKDIIEDIIYLKFLNIFELNIFKLSQEIQDIYTKTQKKYFGGNSKNSIAEVISINKDFYSYIFDNFLIIDNYLNIKELFRKVSKCLIISYLTTIEKDKQYKEYKDNYSSYSITKFIYEDFYYIIEYSDFSEIKDFPNNLELKEDTVEKKLITSFNNIINYYIENKIEKSNIFIDKINNFLILFSKIKLTIDQSHNVILNNIIKLLNRYNDIKLYDQINYFLVNNYNKSNNKFNCELLEKLIILIISNSSDFKYAEYHHYLIEGFLNNTNSLIIDSNVEYKLIEEKKLLNKINKISDDYIKLLCILSIYKFLTNKEKINDILNYIIKNITIDISKYIHFLYKLLYLKIIDISNEELLLVIKYNLQYNKKLDLFNNIELIDLLHIVNYLVINNKFDVELVIKICSMLNDYKRKTFEMDKSFKKQFDMFFNLIQLNSGLTNIDYTTLNIMDLLYVKEEKINNIKEHISKNKETKQNLIKKLLEEYKNISNDENIQKYIIDKINEIIIDIFG